MPSVRVDNGDAAGRMILAVLKCDVGMVTNRDLIEMRSFMKFGTSNAE